MTEQKLKKKIFQKSVYRVPNSSTLPKIQKNLVDLTKEETMDPSKWNEVYKQAENLYLIKEFRFCYIKCIDLFKSIINLFKNKLNLEKNSDINTLIFKINEISPKLANIFKQIVDLDTRYNGNNDEKDLERILLLLNHFFLLIKIQKKNPSNSSAPNIKKKMVGLDDDTNGEIEDTLWDELKNAIINFEKKNK